MRRRKPRTEHDGLRPPEAPWVLLEDVPDPTVVVDGRGRILFASTLALRTFGYASDELIGQPIERLIPSRHRAGHVARVAQFNADPSRRAMGQGRELSGRRKDGSEFAVDIALSPRQGPDGLEVIAAIRDVSARKEVEAQIVDTLIELGRSQAELDCAPVSIALLDGEGRIRHVNEAWRRFGHENGADDATVSGVGLDYVAACRAAADPIAVALADAIPEILAGRARHFVARYPCHGPAQRRWFEVRVERPASLEDAAVVMHLDVSQQHQAEQLVTVQGAIAAGLARGSSVLAIGRELLRTVCDGLDWDCGVLWAPDADRRLRCAALWTNPELDLGAFERETISLVLPEGATAVGAAWQTGEVQRIDLDDAEAATPRHAAARAHHLAGGLAFPLAVEGEAFLVVEFFSRIRLGDEDALLRMLHAAATQLGTLVRRQEAEARAAAANEKAAIARANLHAVLECAPSFILALDREGRIDFINRGGPTISKDALTGRSWRDFVPATDQPRFATLLRGVLVDGRVGTYELELSLPDGPRWFAAALGPMRREEGEAIVGAVILARDITEQKRLESELTSAARMASMGSLASGVAHEINNPLASVMANLDLALEDATALTERLGLDGTLIEELKDAHDSAERVRLIVRDLKNLSRGGDEIATIIDVQQLLDSTLRIAGNELRHRAQVTRAWGDPPPVEASVSRLGQVFLNLVMNAAQAIPEGQADRNEIRVATRAEGAMVVIEIADSGIGMSPEVMARAFDPFFTTRPRGSGTGLGLTICHRIVSELAGTIEVESRPGHGSTFRVKLPAAAAPDEPITATPPLAVAGPRRGRVLAIDDEAAIGVVVRRTLGADHEVVTTTSALEGLNLVAAGERFDVILCDVMMPEVTGREFFERLGALAPDLAERVIFLTGGTFTAETAEFLDHVPNLKIDKPFDVTQLRAVVDARVAARPPEPPP